MEKIKETEKIDDKIKNIDPDFYVDDNNELEQIISSYKKLRDDLLFIGKHFNEKINALDKKVLDIKEKNEHFSRFEKIIDEIIYYKTLPENNYVEVVYQLKTNNELLKKHNDFLVEKLKFFEERINELENKKSRKWF